jgi:hypothetical protein
MSIDRSILYQKVEETLNRFQETAEFDFDLILYLIRKIIFHDPTRDCYLKGSRADWKSLPNSKSLFYADENKGLPIGNLSSQLFGNVYLNDFDHFIKCKLRCKYYGRYVDDFVIIHSDKEYLKSIIPVLGEYLQIHLSLDIHPKKIYLQHFSKGVSFLGTVIKPFRIYIRNRTKGNFYRKIQEWNALIEEQPNLTKEDLKHFLCSINSYLGIMKNYNTYKLRRKMLTQCLSSSFLRYVYFLNDYNKLALKPNKLVKQKA